MDGLEMGKGSAPADQRVQGLAPCDSGHGVGEESGEEAGGVGWGGDGREDGNEGGWECETEVVGSDER